MPDARLRLDRKCAGQRPCVSRFPERRFSPSWQGRRDDGVVDGRARVAGKRGRCLSFFSSSFPGVVARCKVTLPGVRPTEWQARWPAWEASMGPSAILWDVASGKLGDLSPLSLSGSLPSKKVHFQLITEWIRVRVHASPLDASTPTAPVSTETLATQQGSTASDRTIEASDTGTFGSIDVVFFEAGRPKSPPFFQPSHQPLACGAHTKVAGCGS